MFAMPAATHARSVHPDEKTNQQDPEPIILNEVTHDTPPIQ